MSTTKPFGTFFLPGPTEVRDEVLAAMVRPMIPHRGAEFEDLFERLQQGLRLHQLIVGHGDDGSRNSLRASGADSLSRERSVLRTIRAYRVDVRT